MLSKLELVYDLDVDMVGEVLEQVKDPQIGTEVKVYIPRIMQNIKKDEPKEYISHITYNNCFVNASACKPKLTSNTFTEQNYLVAKMENSADLTPVMDYLRDDEGDLLETRLDKEKGVRCTFKNGKLMQLRLNTDDTLSNQSAEIDPKSGKKI